MRYRTLFAVFFLLLLPLMLAGECFIRSGTRIAFLGDSITQHGNTQPAGYVNLIMRGLKANGIDAVKIPAGKSGNRSFHMLHRLKKDVLDHRPDILTVSCGVNDVWHQDIGQGVPLEEFQKNIRSIVRQAKNAKIKVILFTATMIRENPANKQNKRLIPYNDFLRDLAEKEQCLLLDLNQIMQRELAGMKQRYPDAPGPFLTIDGIHMNVPGNMMMAREFLKLAGFTEKELARAEKTWKNLRFHENFFMSAGEYNAIAEKAFQKKTNVRNYIHELIRNDLKTSNKGETRP